MNLDVLPSPVALTSEKFCGHGMEWIFSFKSILSESGVGLGFLIKSLKNFKSGAGLKFGCILNGFRGIYRGEKMRVWFSWWVLKSA